MKLNTKYNINDKVYIIPIKTWGKIIGLNFYTVLKYDIRFFNGFDPKECLFLEDELSLQEENTKLGFGNK